MHWRKPLSDRFPYRGFERTNIVLTGRERCQEFTVTWTPAPMADRGRFMCVYKDVAHREYAQADLNRLPGQGRGLPGVQRRAVSTGASTRATRCIRRSTASTTSTGMRAWSTGS